MYTVALKLHAAGQLTKAIAAAKACLQLQQNVLENKHHPYILLVTYTLVVCLYDVGRVDEAVNTAKTCLQRHRLVLKNQHPKPSSNLVLALFVTMVVTICSSAG